MLWTIKFKYSKLAVPFPSLRCGDDVKPKEKMIIILIIIGSLEQIQSNWSIISKLAKTHTQNVMNKTKIKMNQKN